MPAYIYGDYVYFDKEKNAPKEHYIQSLLKSKTNIYITSLSKLIDETLEYLPKLFFVKIIKEWMFEHVKFVDQLSRVGDWNK